MYCLSTTGRKKNSRGQSKVISSSGLPQSFLVGLLFKSQTSGNSLFQLSMEICKFPWFQKQAMDCIKHEVHPDFVVLQEFTMEHKTWTGLLLEAEDKKRRSINLKFPALSQKISSFSHLFSSLCPGLEKTSSSEKADYYSLKGRRKKMKRVNHLAASSLTDCGHFIHLATTASKFQAQNFPFFASCLLLILIPLHF